MSPNKNSGLSMRATRTHRQATEFNVETRGAKKLQPSEGRPTPAGNKFDDRDTLTAGQRLAGTVEILEQVLLRVPFWDLLVNLQRVNMQVKATIDGSQKLQEKLWFRQRPGPIPQGRRNMANPYFFNAFEENTAGMAL